MYDSDLDYEMDTVPDENQTAKTSEVKLFAEKMIETEVEQPQSEVFKVLGITTELFAKCQSLWENVDPTDKTNKKKVDKNLHARVS